MLDFNQIWILLMYSWIVIDVHRCFLLFSKIFVRLHDFINFYWFWWMFTILICFLWIYIDRYYFEWFAFLLQVVLPFRRWQLCQRARIGKETAAVRLRSRLVPWQAVHPWALGDPWQGQFTGKHALTSTYKKPILNPKGCYWPSPNPAYFKKVNSIRSGL